MIITEFDNPLTAEDARKIALNNRDDSTDRIRLRELMEQIKKSASYGYTRTITSPKSRDFHPSELVQKTLRSFGFKVLEKRAYQWDKERQDWSKEKPALDFEGKEQFFLEITWG